MKASMKKLAPVYTTARMVREYTETYYVTAGRRARNLAENDFARAKALILWKEKLRSHWGEVRVRSVMAEADKLSAGASVPVRAVIELGSVITPEDVVVQLYAGPVDADRNLVETIIAVLTPEGSAESEGKYRYHGMLPSDKSGHLGFTVRVVPSHPDAVLPQELPLIAWE
jgi:starch phosphorylase